EVAQVDQVACGRIEGPFGSEGADVELVDHLAGRRDAAPVRVAPLEAIGIDDLRPAGRSFRLEPRRRVRNRVAAVEREGVAAAVTELVRRTGEVSTLLTAQGRAESLLADDRDGLPARRPDAEVDAIGPYLGSDRHPTGLSHGYSHRAIASRVPRSH